MGTKCETMPAPPAVMRMPDGDADAVLSLLLEEDLRAAAPAVVFFRSLDELPDAGRVFQVCGVDCDRERFRLWVLAGDTETAEEVRARTEAHFDDSWISSVEEEVFS